ncbi:unnamed protein product [Adineta ricciae]|uniref:Zinc finger RNA-binding protein n=1 Tax=Adineta ricciae TaxID=249248 RepID=A0A814IG27_ADIRI|nr:unnamed protein product [Adineta ricciae]CAF1055059.1 unnamed protein product [Adineta ricciae]
MSNNGMNYPMYNTFPYPHIVQQQPFYRQDYPRRYSQPPITPYANQPAYPSASNQSQQYNNSYDHLIQSAAETLAAFTAPSEQPVMNRPRLLPPQRAIRRTGMNSTYTPKVPTRTYYCETCRIECGGHASYQAHIQGAKHIKKAGNCQTQSKTSNVFLCELCDITCTNVDAYHAHLEGNKHQKTLKLHLKLGKTIPQPTPLSSLTSNESQSEIINEIKQSGYNSMQLLGVEYIETLHDDTNTIKSYYCKLCNCTFNDANARDTHLKGKRHQLSYKKKVDPNLKIDVNNRTKPSSPKHQSNLTGQPDCPQESNSQNSQTEFDDDTKYLMMLHEQIVPSEHLLGIIERFVSNVETALQSCSEQLSVSSMSTTANTLGTVINKSPLLGFSRIGSFVKNLLIKTDRIFHIVIVCVEWPTRELIDKVVSMLSEIWKNDNGIQCQRNEDGIRVYTHTSEGQMCVSMSFTSFTISTTNNKMSNQDLSRTRYSTDIDAMHSVRWFQKQIIGRQHASALIRCLLYKTKISSRWRALPSEAIEIIIDNVLSKSTSPIGAFRRVLEYLAGGLVLSNGPGIRKPWETDAINNICSNLTDQEREDITHEAQNGLRLLTFGRLNSWFEHSHSATTSLQKRSHADDDNRNLAKRQCT